MSVGGFAIEVRTQRDVGVLPRYVNGLPLVRLFYREAGQRVWRRKLIIPAEGVTLEAIELAAETIAARIIAGIDTTDEWRAL